MCERERTWESVYSCICMCVYMFWVCHCFATHTVKPQRRHRSNPNPRSSTADRRHQETQGQLFTSDSQALVEVSSHYVIAVWLQNISSHLITPNHPSFNSIQIKENFVSSVCSCYLCLNSSLSPFLCFLLFFPFSAFSLLKVLPWDLQIRFRSQQTSYRCC